LLLIRKDSVNYHGIIIFFDFIYCNASKNDYLGVFG